MYLILVCALLVRIVGLGWYLPHTYNYDEYHVVGRAINLISPNSAEVVFDSEDAEGILRYKLLPEHRGWFIPIRLMYPPLYIFVQALAYRTCYLFTLLKVSFPPVEEVGLTELFLAGRFTTALFGLLTVLLVYLVGKMMYSRKVGLISSLFLSFTFLHITSSRTVKPGIPMTFFIILAFLFIYLIYRRGRVWYYILGAIFIGLSVATKFMGGVLIIPIFLAHLFHGLERKKRLASILFDKKIVLLFLFLVGGFLLGYPWGVLRLPHLLGVFWRQVYIRAIRPVGPYRMSGWSYYLTIALRRGMGLPLEITCLAGIAYGVFRHRWKDILLLSFPVALFLIVGSFYYYADHYLVPILPFLAIVGAVFLVEITSKVPWSKRWQNGTIAILALAIILLPGLGIVRYLHLLTREGTGVRAKKWIEKNIPAGSKIALEHYAPPISWERYHLFQPPSLGIAPLNWYKERKYDYIVASSFMYDRYLKPKSKGVRHHKANYLDIDENSALIKEFNPPPFYLYNPNPVIKIYRIDYDHPYLKFPENFEWYSQKIRVKKVEEGWLLQSQISHTGSIQDHEYVRDPYVRLLDSKGLEIAKLLLHRGRIDRTRDFSSEEKSILLPFLPPNHRIVIGYGYSYESPPNEGSSGTPYFREFDLGYERGYPLGDYELDLIYRKLPGTHFAEYGQMVVLFRSRTGNILWSRIFRGELTGGNDYVLNPYVRIAEVEGGEVIKLLIYNGTVGAIGSVLGPRENSLILPNLPSGYKVYIGYDYYYDVSHKEKAGGPLEVEIGQILGEWSQSGLS